LRLKVSPLFDDLVGAREEGWRDGEPERLGGFEVDHQLEFGRLFDGKIGRLVSSRSYPRRRTEPTVDF
jgi:hypothetical protein